MCKKILYVFIIAFVLAIPKAGYADHEDNFRVGGGETALEEDIMEDFGGDFDREWHGTESHTDIQRGESGVDTQEIEWRGNAADGQGNRRDFEMTHVTHPDGAVTETQKVTLTNERRGITITENVICKYDAKGNLVGEKHTLQRGRAKPVNAPACALETEEVIDPGTPEERRSTVTYWGDMVKGASPPYPTDVTDLGTEKVCQIDHGGRKYRFFSMYICEEPWQMLEKGDTAEARAEWEAGIKEMEAHIAEMDKAAGVKPDTMEGGKIEPEDVLGPRKLSYEFTGETTVIAGYLAERVLIRDKGRLYKEIWLALHINPLAILEAENISQKAKDYFFFPPDPTPRLRRAFSHLVLKETTYDRMGLRPEGVRLITDVRYREVKPGEFQPPPGYSKTKASY